MDPNSSNPTPTPTITASPAPSSAPAQVPDPNAELNRLIAQQNTKKSSTLGYIIGSLVIPPFTTVWVMYLAWKKGVLHQLMPIMTIVYTVFFALWSLLMISAPGAFSSYLSQNVPQTPMFDKVTAILLSAAGIGLGIYFKIKANKQGKLSWVWIGLMVAILLLQLWAGYHQLSFISVVTTKAQDINIGI